MHMYVCSVLGVCGGVCACREKVLVKNTNA